MKKALFVSTLLAAVTLISAPNVQAAQLSGGSSCPSNLMSTLDDAFKAVGFGASGAAVCANLAPGDELVVEVFLKDTSHYPIFATGEGQMGEVEVRVYDDTMRTLAGNQAFPEGQARLNAHYIDFFPPASGKYYLGVLNRKDKDAGAGSVALNWGSSKPPYLSPQNVAMGTPCGTSACQGPKVNYVPVLPLNAVAAPPPSCATGACSQPRNYAYYGYVGNSYAPVSYNANGYLPPSYMRSIYEPVTYSPYHYGYVPRRYAPMVLNGMNCPNGDCSWWERY